VEEELLRRSHSLREEKSQASGNRTPEVSQFMEGRFTNIWK
jgi:hypothetical protein